MEGSLTGRATPSLGSGCVLALGVGIVTFLPSWGGSQFLLNIAISGGKKNQDKASLVVCKL